jgi:2,3-bisphosphoglycerate-dependent phosphoglycerate mutase
MSPEQIAEFNIPTGVPRKYQFDSEMTVATVAYLGDPLEIAKATQVVADQSKKDGRK